MGGPVLTIHGDVGAVTGKVRHDGDVRILGSVLSGHEVSASGKVIVARDVRNAQVSAGGDLIVNGLATGEEAVLDAVGNVVLRQATDVQALAGGDIVVRTAAVRAKLYAGRRILLSDPPGTVQGGVLRAGLGVEVVRCRASAGREATVVVGEDPFHEDRDELAHRLTFARSRAQLASSDTPPDLGEYRRQVAQLAAFRSLCEALRRKLQRINAAEEVSGTPYLRVSGPGPVQADVTLGGIEAPQWAAWEWQSGWFAATLVDGEVQVNSLEESARVG